MKLYLCVLVIFLGVFIQTSFSQEQVIPADAIPPAAVTAYSASREQRIHHNFFHIIRMNWALLDPLEQKQIENLGWKPTFVSFTYVNGDINQPITLYGPTGEDFLFMHRRMINEVNQRAQGTGWSVVGWPECPRPDSLEWPVPPVPTSIVEGNSGYAGYLQYYKTDEFYYQEIKPLEDRMNDQNYLRTLTLGEFGTHIEYELHTFFHVRFSAYNPVGYRNQGLHPTEYIDPKWDNPEYDFLADFYSAHVNPTFWKIHGWIELKIQDWCTANGVGDAIDDLVWISTWEKGPMDAEIIEQLYKVGADARARRRYADDYGKEIVGAVLGALVVITLILLAGWFCMSKMLAKNAGYVKPGTNEANL